MISDIVSHMLQGDEVFIPEEVKVDVMNNLYAAIQKNWSKKRNEGLDESDGRDERGEAALQRSS